MVKKHRFTYAVILIALAVLLLVVAYAHLNVQKRRVSFQPAATSDDILGMLSRFPREQYSPLDLDTTIWLSAFARDYRDALSAGAEWVQDPIDVGLRVAGFPNPDQLNPDAVLVFYTKANAATVIVFKDGLMDDSVAALEFRVDLVKDGRVWEIAWLGLRQQCYRTLEQDWTTAKCP